MGAHDLRIPDAPAARPRGPGTGALTSHRRRPAGFRGLRLVAPGAMRPERPLLPPPPALPQSGQRRLWLALALALLFVLLAFGGDWPGP